MGRESDGKDYEAAATSTGAVAEDGKEKSERKRQREKQRRSELTNAFDDLAAMVLKIDCESDADSAELPRKKSKRNPCRLEGGEPCPGDTGGMTRVDLINRALSIMKNLREENSDLKESLQRSGDKDDVFVMVPTLTPVDEESPPPVARGATNARTYRPPSVAPLPQPDHSQPIYVNPGRHPSIPHQGSWTHYPSTGPNHYMPPPPHE